jgi:uncharacterized protein (TIGR02246 family)
MNLARSLRFSMALGALATATALSVAPAAAQVNPIQGGHQRQDVMQYNVESMQEYQNIVREWTTAWSRSDIRRVSRLYVDDATFVPVGGEMLLGRQEIEESLRELVPRRRDMQLQISDFEVRGTLLYGMGTFTYRESLDGEAGSRTVTGTYMTVMQRNGRTWRIRSQIFSPAPAA